MKLKQIITIATTLLTVASAQGRSLVPASQIRQAELTELKLDSQVYFYDNDMDRATVFVNDATQTVKLIIPRKFSCPPNALCAMVMPAPVIIELPIVDRVFNRCGGERIIAELDRTPVDGLHQKITINHEGLMGRCEVYSRHLTEVIYNDYNPWTNLTTESRLYGGALKRLFPRYPILPPPGAVIQPAVILFDEQN